MAVLMFMSLSLSATFGAGGLYITVFSTGSQADISLSSAGSNNSTTIRIPADGIVTATEMRVTGNALNISVDVGEDGIPDWAFYGEGYGSLGRQTMFSDGTTTLALALDDGVEMTKDLLLPKAASIKTAKITLDLGGTENISLTNDRPFTIVDGTNVVELGFEDSAYTSPFIADIDNDGDDDLTVAHQAFTLPSAGVLELYKTRNRFVDPKVEKNDTFSVISTAGTHVHPVLVDIDQDSDLDLVYGAVDGTLRFYENVGTINNPSWTSNTTLFAGIDVGDYSAPAFADIDGNNKLDLIIGNSIGDYHLYNNTGSQANPEFTEVPGALSSIGVNSFATPALADMDGDGDIDIISGDGNGNLVMLQNNGTSTSPLYQLNTTSMTGTWAISSRSTPTIFDMEGDGDKDICAGYANARLVLWKNQAGEGAANPWAIFDGFTMGNMSLSSASSAIEMADLNGDGWEDIVEATVQGGFIAHDHSTNTWGIEFETNGSSFGGLTDAETDVDPTLWDLDNDGDLDMLIGSLTGELDLYRNTGTATAPSWQKVVDWPPVSSIDVGQLSAPELGDLDGDGLPDLIVGANDGFLKYYSNTGTANSPAFTENTTLFASVDYGAGGRTVPELFDIDGDGDLDLFLTYSTPDGWSTVMDCYRNTGTPAVPSFTMDASLLGGTGHVLESPHLGFADTDLDGDHDILLGNDPIRRIYHLEVVSHYDLTTSIDDRSADLHLEAEDAVIQIDVSAQLVQALNAATGTIDANGHRIATLTLGIKAINGFSATAGIDVDYTYTNLMGDLSATLNDYVAAHAHMADPEGMVPVPIEVSTTSGGTVRLFGLNITVDEPPEYLPPAGPLQVNEDGREDRLIDLYTIFKDDFTNPSLMEYEIEFSPAPVNVSRYLVQYVSVDAASGPENDDWHGTFTMVINATDELGLTTSSGNITIEVVPVNDPPIITSTPVTTATVGQLYKYQMNASDVDEGDELTYMTTTSPPGMSVNATTGLVTWTPSEADKGPRNIVLTVSDGKADVNQSFQVNVLPRPIVNHPPVIVSDPVDVAYVGMIYQYNIEATDEDEDALSYLMLPSKNPKGMMINSTNGVINWVPTIDQLGPNNVTVTVTDDKDEVYHNFTVTVEEIDLPPTILSTPVTTAKVGIEYTYTVLARDPEERTLTFGLATFPSGMTIDGGTGKISWTPAAEQVGTVHVALTVTDGNEVVNQTFDIIVSFVQPVVSISNPKEGQEVSGSIKVSGTARMDAGTITKVQVKLDEDDWKDAKGTTQWAFNIDTTGLSNGKHSVSVRALTADTESEIRTVNFEVDNQEGLPSEALMLIGATIGLLALMVAFIIGIVVVRRRARAAPKKGAVAAEGPAEDEDVSDEEMEEDLEEMEREMGEAEDEEVSDEEMEEDLKVMDEKEGADAEE